MDKFDPATAEFLRNGSRITNAKKVGNYWHWISYYERPSSEWCVCESHHSTPDVTFNCVYFDHHGKAFEYYSQLGENE